MKKKQSILLISAGLCFLLFLGLIAALLIADTAPIGPEGSTVGLSTINGSVRDLFDYNETVYKITEVLGYATILIALAYALSGSFRRNINRAEHDKKFRRFAELLGRGAFMKLLVYIGAFVIYILFEKVIINCRPIILPGEALEASFPSSHTVLAVAFIGPAIHDAIVKEKSKTAKWVLTSFFAVLMMAVVVGRLLSGVHWLTDIIGGLLIGATLVLTYAFFYGLRYQDK